MPYILPALLFHYIVLSLLKSKSCQSEPVEDGAIKKSSIKLIRLRQAQTDSISITGLGYHDLKLLKVYKGYKQSFKIISSFLQKSNTMFQLSEIKAAHSKVKSGADFPAYIRDLIKLGVVKYDTFVADGHTLYVGENNYQLQSEPKYAALPVANESNAEQFKHYLKIHQQGQTDYPTFCTHSAETGVEKWTVDMDQMTCTYYDKQGNQMLEEKIPAAA